MIIQTHVGVYYHILSNGEDYISISLLVCLWLRSKNIIFPVFENFEKVKILYHFSTNKIKDNETMEKLNYINKLLWILKHKNKKIIFSTKDFGHGHCQKFFRLKKSFFIANFSFIDRFEQTLNENLCFDQF